MLPLYAGFNDADTRFEFSSHNNQLRIKLYEQQNLLVDQLLDQQSDDHIVGQYCSFDRHKNGYKIHYQGADQSSLALVARLNGDVDFEEAQHTNAQNYKTWGFRTNGTLSNSTNALFYYLYTDAKAFHNMGVLKSWSGHFTQKYGFNNGIMHFGDQEDILEPDFYNIYRNAIKPEAQAQFKENTFDDYGVLLADNGLIISRLTYRVHGLSAIDTLQLKDGASLEVHKRLNVQHAITGQANRVENRGEMSVGRIPAQNFSVQEWNNTGFIYFYQPSEVIAEDFYSNKGGKILASDDVRFGSRNRIESAGLVATAGAIRAAVLNAQESAGVKSILQDAQLYSKKEKIRWLIKILKHTDHYLNTITDHYIRYSNGRQNLDHKSETGYVFQKRTTEVEEKTIEYEQDLPDQLRTLIMEMMNRRSALNKFKDRLKANLRHLGKIKGDMRTIMANLASALAVIGLDEEEITTFLGDRDLEEALTQLVNYSHLDEAGRNRLLAQNNKYSDWIKNIGSSAMRVGQNALEWVKNNPQEVIDLLCTANFAVQKWPIVQRFLYTNIAVNGAAMACGARSAGQVLKTIGKAPSNHNALLNQNAGGGGGDVKPSRNEQQRTHQPVRAPKTLEAFPKAIRADPKTLVQGGGQLRRRWEDRKYIYEWDSRHGTVEKYNKRGHHLGEFDPKTGKQLKGPSLTRKIEP